MRNVPMLELELLSESAITTPLLRLTTALSGVNAAPISQSAASLNNRDSFIVPVCHKNERQHKRYH